MTETPSALGLARYANEYYDAALAVDNDLGSREGYEIISPPPVYFLAAHSIELILKAYLVHSGFNIKDLGTVVKLLFLSQRVQ